MHEENCRWDCRNPDPLQLNATKTVAVYGDVFITYSKEGVYETR